MKESKIGLFVSETWMNHKHMWARGMLSIIAKGLKASQALHTNNWLQKQNECGMQT